MVGPLVVKRLTEFIYKLITYLCLFQLLKKASKFFWLIDKWISIINIPKILYFFRFTWRIIWFNNFWQKWLLLGNYFGSLKTWVNIAIAWYGWAINILCWITEMFTFNVMSICTALFWTALLFARTYFGKANLVVFPADLLLWIKKILTTFLLKNKR